MNIKVIKETKFKDVLVSIRFRSLLEEEHVANKVLLSDLLSNVCKRYPTKQNVVDKLNEVYGASFATNCVTYGKSQVLEFSVKAIHSSYIHNEMNLLEEQIKILSDFILEPCLDDKGFFLERDVEEAKRMTMSKITRNLDEPSQLCTHNAIKIVGQGQALGVNPADHLDAIQAVNGESLKLFYNDMIAADVVDVLVVGDIQQEEAEALFEKYFDIKQRDTKVETSYALKTNTLDEWNYGDKDITQSYISMVYATNTLNTDDDFCALRVANGILGQSPSSLLFREVREKHSLCYSIHSSILAYDGVLGINVGVDPKNVNKTVSLIKQQVERVCIGDFEDEVLETTKLMLINMVRSYLDNMNAMTSLAYRNMILNSDESIDDMIKKIENVNKEDVVNAMNKCTYLSGYVLQKGGAEHEVSGE